MLYKNINRFDDICWRLPVYFILIVWLRFVNHLLNYYLLTYLEWKTFGRSGIRPEPRCGISLLFPGPIAGGEGLLPPHTQNPSPALSLRSAGLAPPPLNETSSARPWLFFFIHSILSLHFNGHFPGVYWSKIWWRWWLVTTGLLEL